MADANTPLLPTELEAAFRQAAPVDQLRRAHSVNAIMATVHTMPAPRRWSLPPSMSRWRRRGMLAPAGGLAVTALMALWMGVTALTDVFQRGSSAVLARAEFIGDTVIARLVPVVDETRLVRAGGMAAALHDTLYDTMRIVRFALRAPEASQVTLVGTSSANEPDAQESRIAVARDIASGLWEMRTVLPRDAVASAFAFVVDDAQRIPVRSPVTVHSVWTREQALGDTAF